MSGEEVTSATGRRSSARDVLSRRADGSEEVDEAGSRDRRGAACRKRPRAEGRMGHAPRVCGVCRPCDRRPFRRGVTRIHRRRRRELNATATRAAFFPRARAADTSSVELKSKSRARVSRRGRTRSSPDSRARRARARAPSPPTPAWGCGRACWWRSAWRRRRCASRRARGRDPRGRDAGAPPSRDPPSPTRKGHRTLSRVGCFCPSSSS